MTKIIISAGSGTGKTSLVNLMCNHNFHIMKSYTTRNPRGTNDEEYEFVSKEKFIELMQEDFFLETELVFDNYYGTPKVLPEENLIFNVDVYGALKLKHLMPDAISIFLLPPSLEELKQRLINRGELNIDKRLQRLQEELRMAHHFHHLVINNILEDALLEIMWILTLHESKHKALDLLNSLQVEQQPI